MPTVIVSFLVSYGVSTVIATAIANFVISYIISSIFAPDAPEAPKDQGVSSRIPTDSKNKLPVVYGEARVAGQTTFADISLDNQTMYFIISLCEGPVEDIYDIEWQDKVLNYTDSTTLAGIKTGANTLPGRRGSVISTLLGAAPTAITDGAAFRGDEDSSAEASVGSAINADNVAFDFLGDNSVYGESENIKIVVFPDGGRCRPMETHSARWNADKDNRTMPNVAYAYVEITYNRDDRVTGLPSNLFFKVKGKKVGRLKTTGTVNAYDTATLAVTDNPVDNLIDYLTNSTYGCDLPLSGLDLDSFKVHKDFCDEQVEHTSDNYCEFVTTGTNVATTVSGGSVLSQDGQLAYAKPYNNQRDCESARAFNGTTSIGGTWMETMNTSVSRPRYTLNGQMNTNNDLDRNISDMTVGNGGALTYNLGKFGLISQSPVDSVRDFSEDNIVGKLEITGAGFDKVLNSITTKFTSPRQRYRQEQVILDRDPSAGNPNEPRLEKTLQLPYTISNVEATRVGTVILNESRQTLSVSFQAGIEHSDLQAGDVIRITHATPNWRNKEFRINQITEQVVDQEAASLGVRMLVTEYAETVYTDANIQLVDPAPNTNYGNPLIAEKFTVNATDDTKVIGLGSVPQINLALAGVSDNAFTTAYDVTVTNTTADPDVVVNRETFSTLPTTLSTGLDFGTNYTVGVVARNAFGVGGGEVTDIVMTSGVPMPAPTGIRNSLAFDTGRTTTVAMSVTGAIFVNDTITLTVGGTPFTYTVVSGDGINAITAGLASAINANSLYTASSTTSTITISATDAGDFITVLSSNALGSAVYSAEITTAEEGVYEETTLSATATAGTSVRTVTVDSTTGFPSAGIIRIGTIGAGNSEKFAYDGTTGTTFTNTVDQTLTSTHSIGTVVSTDDNKREFNTPFWQIAWDDVVANSPDQTVKDFFDHYDVLIYDSSSNLLRQVNVGSEIAYEYTQAQAEVDYGSATARSIFVDVQAVSTQGIRST